MPKIPGLTHAQSAFLRAFHQNPAGPLPDAWPTPAILRRWLRKPTFRRAYRSLRKTLRSQMELQMLCASNHALTLLQGSLGQPLPELTRRLCMDLLKLAHHRLPRLQPRKPQPHPEEPEDEDAAIEELARERGHPDVPFEKTVALFKEFVQKGRQPDPP